MNTLNSAVENILNLARNGWCWPQKALAMAELIQDARPHPQMIVEIGVFGGQSLLPQAEAVRRNNTGLIIGIDPWHNSAALEGQTNGKHAEWWSTINLNTIHAEFMEHLWQLGLESHCVIIRNTGDQCAPLFAGESIDILHIDGNHTEEVSCRDVRTWLPKVRGKGYIWFDDTNWQTTQKALTLLSEQCTTVRDVGTCRLFRKR